MSGLQEGTWSCACAEGIVPLKSTFHLDDMLICVVGARERRLRINFLVTWRLVDSFMRAKYLARGNLCARCRR